MLPISIKNEGRKKTRKREGNRGSEKIGKRKEKKRFKCQNNCFAFQYFQRNSYSEFPEALIQARGGQSEEEDEFNEKEEIWLKRCREGRKRKGEQ